MTNKEAEILFPGLGWHDFETPFVFGGANDNDNDSIPPIADDMSDDDCPPSSPLRLELSPSTPPHAHSPQAAQEPNQQPINVDEDSDFSMMPPMPPLELEPNTASNIVVSSPCSSSSSSSSSVEFYSEQPPPAVVAPDDDDNKATSKKRSRADFQDKADKDDRALEKLYEEADSVGSLRDFVDERDTPEIMQQQEEEEEDDDEEEEAEFDDEALLHKIAKFSKPSIPDLHGVYIYPGMTSKDDRFRNRAKAAAKRHARRISDGFMRYPGCKQYVCSAAKDVKLGVLKARNKKVRDMVVDQVKKTDFAEHVKDCAKCQAHGNANMANGHNIKIVVVPGEWMEREDPSEEAMVKVYEYIYNTLVQAKLPVIDSERADQMHSRQFLTPARLAGNSRRPPSSAAAAHDNDSDDDDDESSLAPQQAPPAAAKKGGKKTSRPRPVMVKLDKSGRK